MANKKTNEDGRVQEHDLDPDERFLTERQAVHLAHKTGVDSDRLIGRRVGELTELLDWRIDRLTLFSRKVCGRVVKTDPVTGEVHGVPGATVHVMDTDYSFLGYFPAAHPYWWWLWPFNYREEEIASTVTDECGYFCVWIPRWDIDRLLSWRKETVCFPDAFKPNLGDLIKLPDRLDIGPDPREIQFDPDRVRIAAEMIGDGFAERVDRVISERSLGDPDLTAQLMKTPAFGMGEFPPPVTLDALDRLEREGLEIKDPRATRALGPFVRCHDFYIPEWTTIVDFPDITFKVTQDTDNDGDEEVIYDEGLFDVRWNATNIPDVVIEAWPGARVSEICDGPDVACQDVPHISNVGLMPLVATHHDTDGYSTRVNRPHPLGLTSSPPAPGESANAPYAGTLQLHGCHHIDGADFYRLKYKYRPTVTDPFTSEVPFTGLSWWAPRVGGLSPIHVVPDSDGWYPILPQAQMSFPHWLLNWPTTNPGQYEVVVEVADGAKNPISQSAAVRFMIDNRPPNAGFNQLRWRVKGAAGWTLLPAVCPVIQRPTGSTIELEVDWHASAVHFRDATLAANGCGGANPVKLDGPPPVGQPGAKSDFDHWHTDSNDNSMADTGRFEIPATAKAGCYSVRIDAHTRAFNPAGDGGGPTVNWKTNYAYKHAHPGRSVSIVDV